MISRKICWPHRAEFIRSSPVEECTKSSLDNISKWGEINKEKHIFFILLQLVNSQKNKQEEKRHPGFDPQYHKRNKDNPKQENKVHNFYWYVNAYSQEGGENSKKQ